MSLVMQVSIANRMLIVKFDLSEAAGNPNHAMLM